MAASSPFPTENAAALRSFVRGQECFRLYWGTRTFTDLERAQQQFEEAENSDPSFVLASFYAAVADNELRKHDAAIRRLNSIVQRDHSLLPQTYLQLAYAHTKKYTDEDWDQAEAALDRADVEAKSHGLAKLLPTIESYRVFLYSVIGGRSKRRDRERYLNEAINRGQRLLRRARAGSLVRRIHAGWMLRGAPAGYVENNESLLVEVQNALGIAYMRRGQFARDTEARARLWNLAEQYYGAALQQNPNVIRVLQNQGTLRLLQGDDRLSTDRTTALARYTEARDLYRRTLGINPHDQFPHYRMALSCAKLNDWNCALDYFNSGPKEPGSVRADHWRALKEAIDTKDVTRLPDVS
jgi:hypothetical protein